MSFKFNVGDEVVGVGSIFALGGRPTVRKITGRGVKDGKNSYTGHMWRASEDNLVLASEFQWPSELEMRIQDKRVKDRMQKDLEEIARHHEEG